jgi:hypothetical protein
MQKVERRVSLSSADAREHDGFSWRKYGQKEILGAQHPRFVFAHFSSLTFSEPNPYRFIFGSDKDIFSFWIWTLVVPMASTCQIG